MASTTNKRLLNQTAMTASASGAKQSLDPSQKAFIAWLKVGNTDGAAVIDAKIQHSPNGTDWVDLVTFTQLSAVNGTEAIQVTDSVFVNIRADVTVASATTGSDVLVELWYDDDKRR